MKPPNVIKIEKCLPVSDIKRYGKDRGMLMQRKSAVAVIVVGTVFSVRGAGWLATYTLATYKRKDGMREVRVRGRQWLRLVKKGINLPSIQWYNLQCIAS